MSIMISVTATGAFSRWTGSSCIASCSSFRLATSHFLGEKAGWPGSGKPPPLRPMVACCWLSARLRVACLADGSFGDEFNHSVGLGVLLARSLVARNAEAGTVAGLDAVADERLEGGLALKVCDVSGDGTAERGEVGSSYTLRLMGEAGRRSCTWSVGKAEFSLLSAAVGHGARLEVGSRCLSEVFSAAELGAEAE